MDILESVSWENQYLCEPSWESSFKSGSNRGYPRPKSSVTSDPQMEIISTLDIKLIHKLYSDNDQWCNSQCLHRGWTPTSECWCCQWLQGSVPSSWLPLLKIWNTKITYTTDLFFFSLNIFVNTVACEHLT